VSNAPARMLAAAGVAGAGVAAAAAAYLVVGDLPGVLYASGICLAAFLGALAILAGRTEGAPSTEVTPETGVAPAQRRPLWRRKVHIIAELEAKLTTTGSELEEHRRALAGLATQLSRETEAAQRNAERLENRIVDLEDERERLQTLLASERERFEQTLDRLGGNIGGHANELAELERELEALIAR
jgi:flagellar motility protein MotE (MotC chaperone)